MQNNYKIQIEDITARGILAVLSKTYPEGQQGEMDAYIHTHQMYGYICRLQSQLTYFLAVYLLIGRLAQLFRLRIIPVETTNAIIKL